MNTAAQEALARAEAEIERANRGALAVTIQFHGTSIAEPDVLQSYQRAYSGVQTALQEDLPEARREAAITLMAGLSRYLARYRLISRVEADYWARVEDLRAMRHRRRVLVARSARAVQRGDDVWSWVQALAPRLALWRADLRLRALHRQLVGLQNAMGFADPPRLDAPPRGGRWVR